ncbi:MAG TPA: hypothetical protein PKJ72_14500 [Deltaproteobacteria bacterium]|nr:MAG: hypothetical protein BWX71_01548 [Deltaproteobacteria bacterium ADurb.Bin072]HNS91245.1 hypothetical protein [Deltaproteobacteria bacterium]
MALDELPEIPIDLNEYRKWKERMEKYGQAGVTVTIQDVEDRLSPPSASRKPQPEES